MKRNTLLYTVALCTVFFISLQSCKKENGIDNETVIKKPYGLYIASANGELLNTNDGDNYLTLFPVDRFPMRSLVYSDSGIFFIKKNLHYSLNNGRDFNVSTTNVAPSVSPWQNGMWSAFDQQRIYVASILGSGVLFSTDEGKNWFEDSKWDAGIIAFGISSFSQLKNNALFCHSNTTDSIYKKDNAGDNWSFVPQVNIPPPTTGNYYLSHFDNTLLMTDQTGVNGVYYSNTPNSGLTWAKYPGLPNRLLHATAAPFDEVLLVGTDSFGVYRLQSGQFVPSNNGLENSTTVYGIVGKDNVYKNGARRRYIYLATNKGIYRSEDLGQNWIQVKPGNYVAVY